MKTFLIALLLLLSSQCCIAQEFEWPDEESAVPAENELSSIEELGNVGASNEALWRQVRGIEEFSELSPEPEYLSEELPDQEQMQTLIEESDEQPDVSEDDFDSMAENFNDESASSFDASSSDRFADHEIDEEQMNELLPPTDGVDYEDVDTDTDGSSEENLACVYVFCRAGDAIVEDASEFRSWTNESCKAANEHYWSIGEDSDDQNYISHLRRYWINSCRDIGREYRCMAGGSC